MKKTNKYIPQPVDTSDVEVPEELRLLAEQAARNVHEVWAQSRMAQGWVYGTARDEALKTHPCLVPYDELPDMEKQYDIDTAMATLKYILKQGYKFTK